MKLVAKVLYPENWLNRVGLVILYLIALPFLILTIPKRWYK
jgi:hypothetical protein